MRALLTAVVLLAIIVTQGTAQLSFSPVFVDSQYDTGEGQDVVVGLSEPILTTPGIPTINESISVEVIAEDLQDGAAFSTDYTVNMRNPASRIFTVNFQPLQSNSTENVIQISEDPILEGRECFRLRLFAVHFAGSALGIFVPQEGLNNTFVDVCIADNDNVQVNFTISEDISVTEGDPAVRLRAEAIGIYANEIEIGVVCSEPAVTGEDTAFPGRDFNFTVGTKLHFRDVGSNQSLSFDEVVIPIINDDVAEPRESFQCTFQGGTVNVLQMEPIQVKIEIHDDDELIIHWTKDFYVFDESELASIELVTDSEFEVDQISILGNPAAIPGGSPNRKTALSVPGPFISGFSTLAATIGQAQFGGKCYGAAEVIQAGRSDVLQTSNDFVFTPASKSASANFTIVNDNVLEFDELFIAEFNFGSEIENNWNARKGTPSTAFILIRDDDSVNVTFNKESYSVSESEGQVSISLRIDGQFFIPLYAIIKVNEGTATDPEDYTSTIRYNVTFRQTAFQDSGSPEKSAISERIYINITNDDILEGLEYFQVRIVETSDMFRVRIGRRDTVNVTIIDDDMFEVYFGPSEYKVMEGGNVAISLNGNKASSVPYNLTVTLMDVTAIEGEDYTGREFTVMFPAGATRASFTILSIHDNVFERDESFSLTLEIPQAAHDIGVMMGDPFMANVTITNDDPSVSIDIEQRVVDVTENQGVAEVCLVKSGTSSRPIMAVISTEEIVDLAGSPAIMGAMGDMDFELEPSAASIVLTGDETRKCSNVTIIDDEIVEMMEMFEVIITFPPGQEAVDIGEIVPAAKQLSETVIIFDNDNITVQFAQEMYMVRESDGLVDITVVASGRTSFAYMFTVTPMDITATSNADYVFSTTTYEFLPAGANEPTPSTVISIPLISDDDDEFDETFKLTIVVSDDARESNVTEGQISSTDVLIVDDDDVTVSFSPQNYTVPEGDPAEVMMVLNKPSVKNFTVTVTTMDITAQSTIDYSGGSFDVSIPAGTTKVTLLVHALTDNFVEDDEYFKAALSLFGALEDVVVGSPNVAFFTITDVSSFIPVRFNPFNYFAREGVDSNAVVTLEALGNHPDFSFTVTVHTQDGTATRGSDYQGESFSVVFPAGDNVISFNVPIIDDSIAELAESFTLDLEIPAASAAMGVFKESSGADSAIVYIVDNNVVNNNRTDGNGCPNEEDSVWRIQWPATPPDSTQSVACPGEGDTPGLGLAHRRCLPGGVWGSVDASECESVAVRAVRMKTEEFIKGLEGSNSTLTDDERNAFQNVSQDLNAALQPIITAEDESSVPPQDLKTVARFVEVVADLGENNGLFDEEANETQQVVADILSNVLDDRNTPAFEATAQKSSSADPEDGKTTTPATSILQSTERVVNVVAATLSEDKDSFTISRPNLAMNGQRFLSNSPQAGIVFPGPGVTLPSFRKPEGLPHIQLPRAFLLVARGIEAPSDNDTIEVVNVIMNNMENYLPTDVIEDDNEILPVVDCGTKMLSEGEVEDTIPASLVLSSQIPGYDGGEVDTNETVEVMFPLNERAQNLTVPSGRVKQFRCAFFNFTGGANQTGGWSYRGVESEVMNDTHVHCKASHLTSFAVLVSIVPAMEDPLPLDYITYIGCSISFLCLLASIIFFLSLRKELIKKLHNFVHLNLCIALSLGLLLFLTGIQTATANIHACKFVTALLHYFFLATFTWTLCEAILIYILLVEVFGANDRKWIYVYLVLGWVLPIPVVVITAGVSHDNYLIRSSFDQSHPHYDVIKACWLPSENGVIFAFIGPMVAIILVNAVLLIISLVSLAKSQCGMASTMESDKDERRQKYMEVGKHLLKATVIMLPLLGFTWIIGLFAVGEEGKVFAYLFVIANVFQGLFIFLLHVVRNEKVYGRIKDKLPKSIWKRVTLTTRSGSTAVSRGTRSGQQSTWIDSKKGSSFAAESEIIIEFGGKKTEEDVGSIKDGEGLEMKLNLIDEKTEDQKGSDFEEQVTMTTTSFGITAATTGALEEKEETVKVDNNREGENLEMTVAALDEKSDDQKANDNEEPISTTDFGMMAATAEALAEEGDA